jgi:alanine racemase
MSVARSRPARIDVDLGAIEANVAALAAHVAPAQVCVVAKAGGYGHGAVHVARAAVAGGASWLAVAVAEEAAEVRAAGIDLPILLLAEVEDADAAALVVEHDITPSAYSAPGIARLADAASPSHPLAVHLKVNTGMNRLGAPIEDFLALARTVGDSATLSVGGVWTHLAVADEPARGETADQLKRFEGVLDELADAGIDPGIRHAANSAGAICHPRSHYDLVRCGLASYGIAPSAAADGVVALRPAMSIRATVTFTTRVPAGDGISYGLDGAADRPRTIATIPLGYADGIDRRLGFGAGRVLVGGVARPIVGAVTMDQLMVDCGDDAVARGDEAVLLGRQGGVEISAADWADWTGMIRYEVVSRTGPRLPRTPVRLEGSEDGRS